jgi:polygalacturonase
VSDVNLRDFGAVGDGTTDNTEAIQTAIDACCADEVCDTVVFPEGTYRIEDLP